MKNDILSPHWYRVANLQPKLHSHIEIHRHDYRGLIWYLLEDTTSGRNHRFNPAAYQFIGQLDGSRSVQDIFIQLGKQLEDYAPGQEDIIQLMGQLYAADLIQTDTLIDTEELFDRQAQHKSSKIKQRFSNPVAQKVPLWDPESFLSKHINKVRWLFSTWVALVWILLIGYSLLQAVIHWPQISHHFSVNALSPYNLLLVFLLYPPIKFLHELGHAFSAKLEGGEVHEMGINFLMFMPIPYVNVSTATHFRNKFKRILVSAAGILVESFLAALGLLLFLATEPGLIQEIGFNIFMIGGVSSLFFNGNPLLKYDGYYILADAVAIPNLYQRSAHYWRYWFQRYLFGIREASSPANAPGETFWFITYSILSLLYRLAVLWFIFVVVTEKFFILGIVLAFWLLSLQIFLPVYKALQFIVSSPDLRHKRQRALVASTALVSILVAVVGFMPVPSYTIAEGVVWQPEEALIKAEQDGFAGALQVENNQLIKAGTLVIRLHDTFLETEAKIARAKVRELRSQYRAKRVTNFIEAGIIKEAVIVAESELNHIIEKINSMAVTTNRSGRILLPDADDLPGRFVRQGELLGYILSGEPPTIRMAVSQDNIGQLRQNIKNITIRLASNPHSEYSASIIRQAPEATNQLPSAALTTRGGGKFIINPESENNFLVQERVFLVDLGFDPQQHNIQLGTRAHIRIDHGGETIASQWYRRVRQTFLRQFNV